MIREPQLILVISALLLCQTAYGINNEANSQERNYRVIVDRNPFGLKPPPPPPTNVPAINQPKDEILLTGITSLGAVRAYFMSKAPQGKAPEYYSLGVDEKRNGLEVMEIDPLARSVRVRNSGIETVMTFASNGVKPPAAPAAPPPGTPGGAQAPGVVPNPGGVVMPGMNMTQPGMGGATITPGPAGVQGTPPTGAGRIRTIPSRNVRTAPTGAASGIMPDMNQPAARPDPNAPIQDALMMELQKRAHPNVTFPPTPFPQ